MMVKGYKKGYTLYRVALRIMNTPNKHKDIEKKLGIKATHEHKKGDQLEWKGKIIKNKFYDNDIWILESPMFRNSNFDKHLSWLFKKIFPHKEFLLKLKSKKVKIDISGSYRTGSPTGGFDIHPKFYKLLMELNIPFGVSVQFDEPLYRIFKNV